MSKHQDFTRSCNKTSCHVIFRAQLYNKMRQWILCCFLSQTPEHAGLEGFGQYPVFTAVFTGKYRPGKNRFWTPKVGKTGKNTTKVFKQFHISIKGLIWPWNMLIQDMRILSSCVVWTIVSMQCWANVSYCPSPRFCSWVYTFLAGCLKSHFRGWYRNFLVYWYLKLDNQVVNSTCPKDKLGWIWRADNP